MWIPPGTRLYRSDIQSASNNPQWFASLTSRQNSFDLYKPTIARQSHSSVLDVVNRHSSKSPRVLGEGVRWYLRNALSGAAGVQLSSTFGLTDLAYADDIALLGESSAAVQEAVNQAHRFAAVVGLHINASKTKVL